LFDNYGAVAEKDAKPMIWSDYLLQLPDLGSHISSRRGSTSLLGGSELGRVVKPGLERGFALILADAP
jgi:hypothetical protein